MRWTQLNHCQFENQLLSCQSGSLVPSTSLKITNKNSRCLSHTHLHKSLEKWLEVCRLNVQLYTKGCGTKHIQSYLAQINATCGHYLGTQLLRITLRAKVTSIRECLEMAMSSRQEPYWHILEPYLQLCLGQYASALHVSAVEHHLVQGLTQNSPILHNLANVIVGTVRRIV